MTCPQFSSWPRTEASLGTYLLLPPQVMDKFYGSILVMTIIKNISYLYTMIHRFYCIYSIAPWFSKYIIMSIFRSIFQHSWYELSQPPRHPHRPAGSSAHHHHLALHRERDEADPQDPVRVCVHRLSLSIRITETEHVTVLFQL